MELLFFFSIIVSVSKIFNYSPNSGLFSFSFLLSSYESVDIYYTIYYLNIGVTISFLLFFISSYFSVFLIFNFGDIVLILSCYSILLKFYSNYEYSRFSKVVGSLYKLLDSLAFILLLKPVLIFMISS